MFKIYFNTSIRSLSRNRIYAVINIIGLATGITAMLLAILFWRDEESYDRFHENAPDIYRVTTTLRPYKDKEFETVGGTGQMQGAAFKGGIPEVKNYTRLLGGDFFTNMIANGKTIKLRPYFVDNSFLDIFSFPVIRGSSRNALEKVESVVLTESAATRFFNSVDVVGKLVEIDADPSYQKLGRSLVVTAVIKDPPKNSSLQFDVLFSFPFMRLSFEDNNWMMSYLGTYLLLAPGANVKQVTGKMNRIHEANAGGDRERYIKSFGYDPEFSLGLQNITDIHFNPHKRFEGGEEAGIVNGSDKSYSIVFLVIAGFILMMAAINFINITIAGSIKRSKEVGVRKIAGGSRLQIIGQFLIEASLLCLTSFVFSLLAVYILLPVFNQLTGKQLFTGALFSSSALAWFALLLVVLVAVTGLYPAFILSKFRPAEVLYNRIMRSGSGTLGKALVIIQFTPAVFLLIATLIYYGQMKYMHTINLGYNPSQVITSGVYGSRDYGAALRTLKSEFAREPLFKSVSFGGAGYVRRYEVNGVSFELFRKTGDENFLPMMEIPLVAGRNFIASDADKGMIVNEAFLRAANIDYTPGMPVQLYDYDQRFGRDIVGVVKDYHYASPRTPILPMVILMNKESDGDFWVKVDQAKMSAAITALGKIYTKAMPGSLFEYKLMDEANASDFVKETRWQKVVTIGAVLSFVICWLGLFGLAHLSTYQRIKEIGIRKVLGASLSNIVLLLIGGFIRLVIVAIVIASPLAWMAMNYWLRDFAYHIDIGPGVFLIAAAMALSVTFLSVSYQGFKSALMNPVKSLRTE
ncbi:MAG: ABC transporter permease [Chitinophagaceae bacterium]|nr:ABC transporter permease [Chitinophagaceae bacterium]